MSNRDLSALARLNCILRCSFPSGWLHLVGVVCALVIDLREGLTSGDDWRVAYIDAVKKDCFYT